jgi:hypothetical protein
MNSRLTLISLFLIVFTVFSCKKDNNPDPGTNTILGFWKGSTSPMETSDSYAVGVELNQNGTATSYHYYQSETFPADINSLGVYKCDGTYVITADSVFVTCNGTGSVFEYHAAVNSNFSSMQGKLSFGETASFVMSNLNVTMNK